MVLRPQQAAHLAEHRARLGGEGRPEPCRNAPHLQPQPQTLPTGCRATGHAGWSRQPLRMREGSPLPTHPGTHPPGLPSLHIHTAQTPGKSTVGTDAELLASCALFQVYPQGAYPPRTSPVSCLGGSPVTDRGLSLSYSPSPGLRRLRWYQKVRQAGWVRGWCSSEVREAT